MDNYVEATGHSYEAVVTAPTCTEGGYTTYTCSVCSDSYVADETEATGHTEGEAVVENEVAATCTADGSYDSVVYCTVCGAEISRETVTVPATGHTAGEAVTENKVEATCTEDGSYDTVVYCTVCGEEISRETTAVSAAGHTYETVVTAPTCTEGGYTTYTCSVCGDSYVADETGATGHTEGESVVENEVAATCTTDGAYDRVVYCTVCGAEISRETVTIPATGHTAGEAVTENKVEATCAEDGSYDTVVYCTVCGEEISRETTAVSATGHSYEAVVTEPTCTEGGYTTYTCSVCGDSYVADETGAVGHTEGEAAVENEVAATCTTDGAYDSVVYCTVCGAEISRETVTVSAADHTYEAVVTAPTCTEGGYTTYTCSACGDSYVADETEATGHTWNDGEVTKEATCTEDGVITYTCTVCGETKTEAIEATGHSYETVVTEPTCTEDGYTTYTCSVCGDSYTAGVSGPLNHSEDDPVMENKVDATCTKDGSYDSVIYCSRCGEEMSRETVTTAANGHEYEAAVTAPTCTEQGYTTYTCSVCGESYVSDYTEATGHSYTMSVTGPTCTENGYTTYTCSACGGSYVDDYTEALGHMWDDGEVTKEATETEAGEITYTCTVCGETNSEQIAATGVHTYNDGVVTKEATCTEAGEITYTCTDCGATYTEIIPATGHTYETTAVDPTCAEQGYTTHTCSVCGDTYADSYTEALGHEWGAGTVTTEATCTETGVITYTCTACGETYTETIAATGHTAGNAVIENEVAATCTENGSYDSVVYCTVCNAEISRETITVPATGHDYQAVVTEPTCTEQGYTTYTCSHCGDTYIGDYVDALGHNWENGVCTICGESEKATCEISSVIRVGSTLTIEVNSNLSQDRSVWIVIACYSDGRMLSIRMVNIDLSEGTYMIDGLTFDGVDQYSVYLLDKAAAYAPLCEMWKASVQ